MLQNNRILYFILIFILIFSNCSQHRNIKIGSVQVLTGQMSKYGKTLEAALSAYIDVNKELRREKGLPEIEIITMDSRLEPKTGVSDINQLITVYHVPAVIGALGSSVTLAMAPIAEENKVVLISPASGSPEISGAGKYIFRTCPSDIYEAEFIARYYEKEFSENSLAILYINNDYGVGLKNGFLKTVQNKSLKPLFLSFEQGQNNFRNQLLRIKNDSIKVVYLIGYEEMITIFKQAKEMDVTVNWIGNNQLNDQSMIDKMGNTANGTIFPGHEYELSKIKKEHPEFYTKYLEQSNGQDLDVFAAYGVDALMLIEAAIDNGAKTGTEIKDYLDHIKEFNGLTGTFSFNTDGDPIRTLILYQIMDGKITFLKR